VTRELSRLLWLARLSQCWLSANSNPEPSTTGLFLRAERRPDGVRTFRLTPGKPEPTSYGEGSFRRIFGVAAHPDRERVASS
jgi:hypothetical protein